MKAEELLKPMTSELVILYFKATHFKKKAIPSRACSIPNPTLSGLAGGRGRTLRQK